MSRKKRMQNLRDAKDKRTKKLAVGLSVVLVVALAFEAPKVLHHGGSSSSPPPATTTTPAPTAGTATPAGTPAAAGTAAAAVTPAASTKLPNSDANPHVGKGQLYAFNDFAGKDPFAQQVIDVTAGQPDQSGEDAQGQPEPSNSSDTGTDAAVTHQLPHQSTRTLAVTGAVRIWVNGQVQIVRAGTSFPSANPLFRLVSVDNGVAKIAIANGSYSSGAKTISLSAGRSLTLVDTADGSRYQIRLLA
jgi:hypothetical protein